MRNLISRKLLDELFKSLTFKRGMKFADHQRFTVDIDIDGYSCGPHNSRQRGSIENINRLLQ